MLLMKRLLKGSEDEEDPRSPKLDDAEAKVGNHEGMSSSSSSGSLGGGRTRTSSNESGASDASHRGRRRRLGSRSSSRDGITTSIPQGEQNNNESRKGRKARRTASLGQIVPFNDDEQQSDQHIHTQARRRSLDVQKVKEISNEYPTTSSSSGWFSTKQRKSENRDVINHSNGLPPIAPETPTASDVATHLVRSGRASSVSSSDSFDPEMPFVVRNLDTGERMDLRDVEKEIHNYQSSDKNATDDVGAKPDVATPPGAPIIRATMNNKTESEMNDSKYNDNGSKYNDDGSKPNDDDIKHDADDIKHDADDSKHDDGSKHDTDGIKQDVDRSKHDAAPSESIDMLDEGRDDGDGEIQTTETNASAALHDHLAPDTNKQSVAVTAEVERSDAIIAGVKQSEAVAGEGEQSDIITVGVEQSDDIAVNIKHIDGQLISINRNGDIATERQDVIATPSGSQADVGPPIIEQSDVGASDVDVAPLCLISPQCLAQVAMGVVALKYLIKNKNRNRVASRFAHWKLDLVEEQRLQRHAESLSVEAWECKNLKKENEALRNEMEAFKEQQRQAGATATASLAAGATVSPVAPVMIKLKDHPDFAPWFKMLKMGVPRQAVENKMVSKDIDPTVLDKDPESMVADPSAPASASVPAEPATPALIKLKDHPNFSPWFKMLKMGVPRQAVENKMASKDIDPTVLDKDPESMVPDPNAPAPASRAAKPAAPALIKLKDHPDFSPWFKMLKMGVPRQAVENKMVSKDIDPTVLDKDPESMVPDPNAPTSASVSAEPAAPALIKLKDHPDFGPFFKMLKMGVPRQAVENKMATKELDPTMLDKDPECMVADPSSPAPSAATAQPTAPALIKLKDHPDFSPFFKMLKMGVPRQAVENKMATKELDPTMLDKDPESMVADPSSPAPSAATAPAFIKLKDHPDFGPFFKMLKMGVPRQAVENKMAMKELDPKVLDKDPESMVPDPNVAVPASVAEVQQKRKPVGEDERFAPWFKMLKMGVPRGAVAIKMKAKGLDPKVLDMDPKDCLPADTDIGSAAVVLLKDDPDYGPFFKMLKMGVPRQAVSNKIAAKNLDPAMLDLGPDAPVPKASSSPPPPAPIVAIKDNPKFKPFLQMIKMGVPRGAVGIKMQSKGLDPAVLDMDPTAPSPDESPSASTAMKLVKEDERYQAFFKMIKMGVPRPAVEVKMKSKGMNPAVLDLGPDDPLPVAPVAAAAGNGSVTSATAGGGDLASMLAGGLKGSGGAKFGSKIVIAKKAAPPAKPKPQVVRKKFHWRKLPARLMKSNETAVWHQLFPFDFEPRELSEMKTLFTMKVESPTNKKSKKTLNGQGGKGKASNGKVEPVRLIDMQRANNVQIVMSRMQGVTSEVVCNSLNCMDIPDDVEADDMRTVLHLLPNEQEVQKLKDFKGDKATLGIAEQHFLNILGVTRYMQRSRCLLYKLTYEETYEDAEFDVDQLERACDKMIGNEHFQRILEIILALGNFLNEGTPHAGAPGFSLESLNKLKTVKSYGQKTSALHYLVLVVQSRQRQVLDFVKAETETFRSASRVVISNVVAVTNQLVNGLKLLENELKFVTEKIKSKDEEEKKAKAAAAAAGGNSKEGTTEAGKSGEGNTEIGKGGQKEVGAVPGAASGESGVKALASSEAGGGAAKPVPGCAIVTGVDTGCAGDTKKDAGDAGGGAAKVADVDANDDDETKKKEGKDKEGQKKLKHSSDPDKVFYLSLDIYYKRVEKEVKAIKARLAVVEEKVKKMLDFYCEDATTTKPEQFFANITTFLDDFSHAQQQNDVSKARALKRARAARKDKEAKEAKAAKNLKSSGSSSGAKAGPERRNAMKKGVRHAKSSVGLMSNGSSGEESGNAHKSLRDTLTRKNTTLRDVHEK